jgi:hypothetical protein
MIDQVYLPCLYVICFVFMFYDSSECFALFFLLCVNFILLFHVVTVQSYDIIIAPFLRPVSVIIFILVTWILLVVGNGTLFRTVYIVHQRSSRPDERAQWSQIDHLLKRDCKVGMMASVVLLYTLLYARKIRNNIQILAIALSICISIHNCSLAEKLSRNVKVETTSDINFLEKNMFFWRESQE